MTTTQAIQWFKQTFSGRLSAAAQNTPYSVDLLCAIAMQETGYIWSVLADKVPVSELAMLCVGDTLDAPNRSAFPKTKAELIAAPRGQEMFDIARKSLEDMAKHVPGYNGAVSNKNKFCHGYGIFQYDLQFFKTDPEYFLQKKWANLDDCFGHCISELKSAQKRQGWQDKTELTDTEKVFVAIAYNRGRADLSKGFKQGHKSSDGRFYGENIFEYLRIAQTINVNGAVIPGPSPAPLPPPTPVLSNKKIYKVKNTTTSLNLRSEPVIPKPNANANVKTSLPGGHLLSWLSGSMNDKWMEAETSVNGAYFKGFVSTAFIELVKDNTVTVPVESPAVVPVAATIPAVYMPRKAGTITKRSEMANAHSLNEPGQPSRPGSGEPQQLAASLHEIISWLNAEKLSHKRYQPTTTATFCNIYAHDYCHLAGVYFPRVWWTQSAIQKISNGVSAEPLINNTIEEIRANNLLRWLKDFGMQFGWRQTGELTKLQEAANLGGVALIIARRIEEGKSGHVTMVVPEIDSVKAKRDAQGHVTSPVQSQAGRTNFRYNTTAAWWQGAQFAEFSFWIHP